MTTKIIMKLPCFFSAVRHLLSVVSPPSSVFSGLSSVVCRPAFALRATVGKLASVVCLLAASAWAGDLTTDNLTVTKDATIMGNMYFSSTTGGTNGGGTATGGTITTNGNYCIHTFTNVGTTDFVVSGGSLTCDVLIVGGGGGGGVNIGGGGGGGGVIYLQQLSLSGSKTVSVGTNGSSAANGGDSTFGTNVAFGGGSGGSESSRSGKNGGCGGGGWGGESGTGGSGSNGQGCNGGGTNVRYQGSAGGGACSVGGNGQHLGGLDCGGNGGMGITNDISGANQIYSSGGGGAAGAYTPYIGSTNYGFGGQGAGDGGVSDNGATLRVRGNASYYGCGGGGGIWLSCGGDVTGGNGFQGIVIVRYSATTSSNITTLSISSNGISQTGASGANVLMGKVGVGTNNPAEQLHVVGNARVDGTNIVSAITLGGETRTTWPTGNLSASNNLSDIADQAAARANLGLGSAATNEAGAFLSPNGDGSQITGITATQVGALSTNAGALIAANNLSDVANQATARDNLGALSTTGGVVNGSLDITGSITAGAPAGDIPMGVYTNQ